MHLYSACNRRTANALDDDGGDGDDDDDGSITMLLCVLL